MRTGCAYSLWSPRRAAADELWAEVAGWIADWYRAAEPVIALPEAWSRGSGTGPVVRERGHDLGCVHTAVDGVPGVLRELRWTFPDAADDSLAWTIDVAVLPGDGTVFTLDLLARCVRVRAARRSRVLRAPRHCLGASRT